MTGDYGFTTSIKSCTMRWTTRNQGENAAGRRGGKSRNAAGREKKTSELSVDALFPHLLARLGSWVVHCECTPSPRK
eukprot:6195124-Prymnesium_polylepis.1